MRLISMDHPELILQSSSRSDLNDKTKVVN